MLTVRRRFRRAAQCVRISRYMGCEMNIGVTQVWPAERTGSVGM